MTYIRNVTNGVIAQFPCEVYTMEYTVSIDIINTPLMNAQIHCFVLCVIIHSATDRSDI
jgi:hypothetical protein